MADFQLLAHLKLAEISEDLWMPFRPGLEILPLHGEPATAGASALLRYQPGAEVPEHLHEDAEYILVLSGSQTDQNGCHTAGNLVINAKGSRHSVVSQNGCVVLAVWTGNLEMLSA
jgi:anti-sigma factor ChrR (cupin superfamily)